MAAIKRLTRGRAWATRLTLLAVLGALLALVVAIVPVLAAPDDPIPPASGAGVTPIEVDLGGQDNDCSAPEVGLGDLYDFRIEDPDGVFTDNQSGFTVTFTVDTYKVNGEEFMDFTVDGASVQGLVIKGGDNSAFYAYSPSVSSDSGTHATRKTNGKLHQVSHASFCYDIVGTISGTKFHDNDTDGSLDPTQESVLSGWTVTAYDDTGAFVGSDVTDSNGDYTIVDVPLGQTYTVCEATNTAGLPTSTQPEVTWMWTQSDLSLNSSQYPFYGLGDCSGLSGQEPVGHEFLMTASVSGIDFGNHREVTVDCSGGSAIEVTLGGTGTDDDPVSTVTFPAGCASGVFTSTFDVGRSNDGDAWEQFVVFGGDPNGAEVLPQMIVWDTETAQYDSNGSLIVPTTQVRLLPGGVLQPVKFCSDDPTLPNPSFSQCLQYRSIAENGPAPVMPGEIQLTEYYLFLGDPSNFR